MRIEKVNCPHQSPSDIKGGFRCSLGLYGGLPYIGNCLKCADRGENNAEYVKSLEYVRITSHPQDKPLVSGCCDSAMNPSRL